MHEVDKRYFQLCIIETQDKPKGSRSDNVEKAKESLYKNIVKIEDLAHKYEKKFERHNNKIEAKYEKEISDITEKAYKKGKYTQFEDVDRLNSLLQMEVKDPYELAFYHWFDFFIKPFYIAKGCSPDIDVVSSPDIGPGWGVTLFGTCFGPSQGKVLLEIKSGYTVELNVRSWSDTRVEVILEPLIGDAGLRPYSGGIWLKTGNGTTSNQWPIMFKPLTSYYWGTWKTHVTGGLFGNTENGVALLGRILDSDFNIWKVLKGPKGKLKFPHASGVQMAQGYHVRAKAFQGKDLKIYYIVTGPKGVSPPSSSGIFSWEIVFPN